MSKEIIITISMDDDVHANVHYEKGKKKSAQRKGKRVDSGDAERVDKDTFKRIKSVERLVDDVRDADVDLSSLDDEDREFLFENDELYSSLTHKTEKQLKRYQAILLGLLQDVEDEEEEEEPPKTRKRKMTSKSKKGKSKKRSEEDEDEEDEEEEVDF